MTAEAAAALLACVAVEHLLCHVEAGSNTTTAGSQCPRHSKLATTNCHIEELLCRISTAGVSGAMTLPSEELIAYL